MLLDVANPDSFARPGIDGIDAWLGIRAAGELVAVGAVLRMADRTGHLRGVSVLPAAARARAGDGGLGGAHRARPGERLGRRDPRRVRRQPRGRRDLRRARLRSGAHLRVRCGQELTEPPQPRPRARRMTTAVAPSR